MNQNHLRWLTWILLCTWVAAVSLLLPLPTTEAEYLDKNKTTLRQILLEESKVQGQSLTDNQLDAKMLEQLSIEKERIWAGWMTRLAIVLAGLIATISCLAWMRLLTLSAVIITSVAFLIVWIFPYLGAQGSALEALLQFGQAVLRSGGFKQIAEFVVLSLLAPAVHLLGIILLSLYIARRRSVR